jgi:hypothetical protein
MKNNTTQGLSNKNVLSFPKLDSLKYWKLSTVICQYNICTVNQSELLSWSSIRHAYGHPRIYQNLVASKKCSWA